MTPSDVSTDVQLDIIDLQCDSNLKERFVSVDLEVYLFSGYPKLRDQAAKFLLHVWNYLPL